MFKDADVKYNGSANRNTWLVGLHIDNEESDYNHWQAKLKKCTSVEQVQRRLRSWVMTWTKDDHPAFFEDMIPGQGGRRAVNWKELAQGYWDELETERKTEADRKINGVWEVVKFADTYDGTSPKAETVFEGRYMGCYAYIMELLREFWHDSPGFKDVGLKQLNAHDKISLLDGYCRLFYKGSKAPENNSAVENTTGK